MRSPVTAALLILLSLGASAQPLPSEQALRTLLDQVMEEVGKNRIESGLATLKPRIIVPEAEFDAMVGQTKLQLPAMVQRFGGSLGHELLREERLGQNLIRYTYIHRFDRHAVRWLFFCYRGKDGWVVNTFRFDDNLPALFQP